MNTIRITKALIGYGTLVSGPGYVSNMHWLVRRKRLARQEIKCERLYKTRADRLTRTTRKRIEVIRTGTVVEIIGRESVLFVGRNLRVWVHKPYADRLLGTTAYASTDSEAVTDKATRWTVAVMPTRVE